MPEDFSVRVAAFRFLEQQTAIHGDPLPLGVLQTGFLFHGTRVPLVGPQGIFKPAVLELPISITTVPRVAGRQRPYEDSFSQDGRSVRYRYRGTDPNHPDNVRLRRTMQTGTPLVYFHGIVPGRYVACWPAYVVGDDPDSLTFTVQVDHPHVVAEPPPAGDDETARRAYATRLTRIRLHQADFRVRVIRAYRDMCAVCRLRHKELLDAAHILPDTDPRGVPVVPNGLALCKLHHAAFDQNVIGIRPDLIVEVNRRVLAEIDGPMLVHGLQGFHGAEISVPRRADDRPNSAFLEERYETFRQVG